MSATTLSKPTHPLNNNNIHSKNDQDSNSTQTNDSPRRRVIPRRSFLRSLGLGATLLGPGAALLRSSEAATQGTEDSGTRLPKGDVAILQFLAAAELIETDLWQQYTELALNNPAYAEALEKLDDEMAQYISDNTDDEKSHARFLNAFLRSRGEKGSTSMPSAPCPAARRRVPTKSAASRI